MFDGSQLFMVNQDILWSASVRLQIQLPGSHVQRAGCLSWFERGELEKGLVWGPVSVVYSPKFSQVCHSSIPVFQEAGKWMQSIMCCSCSPDKAFMYIHIYGIYFSNRVAADIFIICFGVWHPKKTLWPEASTNMALAASKPMHSLNKVGCCQRNDDGNKHPVSWASCVRVTMHTCHDTFSLRVSPEFRVPPTHVGSSFAPWKKALLSRSSFKHASI